MDESVEGQVGCGSPYSPRRTWATRRGRRRASMWVVSCASAVPIRPPTSTSAGQCTPVWTRE